METVKRHSVKRDRIYQYILDSDDHPTADMIYQALRAEIPNLSLGTVYRNLKQLEEDHRIRRVTVTQNSERYDAIMYDHAHFVCRCCGMLKDLKELDEERLRRTLPLPDGYTAESFSVTVTGLCDSCLEKSLN